METSETGLEIAGEAEEEEELVVEEEENGGNGAE